MAVTFLGFNKSESKAIFLILAAIIFATVLNLRIAIRRARDEQRKSDLRSISDALNKYNDEFGFFPQSSPDGYILACGTATTDKLSEFKFEKCMWGKDAIRDISDPSYPAYLERIPQEPFAAKGVTYRYISNGKRYQILAALESSGEPEFNEKIESRQIDCGSQKCNFGLASGNTPLDISIEQFEEQLPKK